MTYRFGNHHHRAFPAPPPAPAGRGRVWEPAGTENHDAATYAIPLVWSCDLDSVTVPAKTRVTQAQLRVVSDRVCFRVRVRGAACATVFARNCDTDTISLMVRVQVLIKFLDGRSVSPPEVGSGPPSAAELPFSKFESDHDG